MNFISDIIKDKAARVHGGANVASANGEEMEQLLEFSRILETLRNSHLAGSRPNLSLSIDQVPFLSKLFLFQFLFLLKIILDKDEVKY